MQSSGLHSIGMTKLAMVLLLQGIVGVGDGTVSLSGYWQGSVSCHQHPRHAMCEHSLVVGCGMVLHVDACLHNFGFIEGGYQRVG